MIVVLCYPAHGTHVYQGLDVVIFSVLKHHLAEIRDALLRDKGQAIDKSNFLEIYAKAHILALTPENIKAAFQKTGVWPFNPEIVTSEMLAPSKETSCESHMPVPPAEPVKILATLLRALSLGSGGIDEDASQCQISVGSIQQIETSTDEEPTHFQILEDAVNDLKKTNLAHLTNSTIPTSSHTMPQSSTLSQVPNSKPTSMMMAALHVQPTTKNELLLLAALRESEIQIQEAEYRSKRAEDHAFTLQASNILNETYTKKIKEQLATQEEKKGKKKGTGRLVGDGLPRLLSGDAFFEAAKKKEMEQHNAEMQKEAKKDGKAAYQEAIEAWKRGEEDRKAENADINNEYRLEIHTWEAKRDAAKTNRLKAPPKPKREELTKQAPKPKLKDFLEGNNVLECEDEADENDDDEGSETD